jgi:hypothetical protein
VISNISVLNIKGKINKIAIMKIIGQFDVKHFMTLPINTKASVVKISTVIITSITAFPFRLVVILVIMSISTFTTSDILYHLCTVHHCKLLYIDNICRFWLSYLCPFCYLLLYNLGKISPPNNCPTYLPTHPNN